MGIGPVHSFIPSLFLFQDKVSLRHIQSIVDGGQCTFFLSLPLYDRWYSKANQLAYLLGSIPFNSVGDDKCINIPGEEEQEATSLPYETSTNIITIIFRPHKKDFHVITSCQTSLERFFLSFFPSSLPPEFTGLCFAQYEYEPSYDIIPVIATLLRRYELPSRREKTQKIE